MRIGLGQNRVDRIRDVRFGVIDRHHTEMSGGPGRPPSQPRTSIKTSPPQAARQDRTALSCRFHIHLFLQCVQHAVHLGQIQHLSAQQVLPDGPSSLHVRQIREDAPTEIAACIPRRVLRRTSSGSSPASRGESARGFARSGGIGSSGMARQNSIRRLSIVGSRTSKP